jgi:hypothetical protein
MAEERRTTDPTSRPEPAKSRKPAKATKAAKATTAGAKATKAEEAAKPTKPAKATEAIKAAKSTKAPTSAEKSAPAAEVAPVPAGPAAPGAWLAAGAEVLRQPDQPPRRAAELAIAELGPRAASWVGWLRASYPEAPAHGIIRLASREARRAGWALAASEAGGPVAALVGLPAEAWVRATLVLRIAAAHGHDPADPRRAGELLELLGLAPPAGAAVPAGEPVQHPGLTGAVGRLGLTRYAVRRFGLPGLAASRLGLGALAGVVVGALVAVGDGADRIDRLAHRADRFYRAGQSQPSARASAASISAPNRP